VTNSHTRLRDGGGVGIGRDRDGGSLPAVRARPARAAGPASPRGQRSSQLRTARAQVQHLRAQLLNMAGSQNEGVARSDAGLRADLRADLQRAVARLAVLEGGPASGTAATSGTARRVRSGGARSDGGSSGGSGTHAGSSADAGGSGDDSVAGSSAAPRDATGHGTQPTQHAPDGEEEDDATDALIGLALYGDDLEEEEEHEVMVEEEEEEEEEEEMLDDEYEDPSPPASDEEEEGGAKRTQWM